jgi:response regulator RpfG family c-di-GMP phosphodiesterase
MSGAILLVDDDIGVLKALERLLHADRHRILSAAGGQEALEILATNEVAVIICDQKMPGLSGAELLAQAAVLCPQAVRITLTGQTDLGSAQECINKGRISRFLLKPWDDQQLRTVVREATHQYELQKEVRRLHDLTEQQRDELKEWNDVLEKRVQERTEALTRAYEDTLNALILALDKREDATGGHSRRVALYCMYLALEMRLSTGDLENVFRGALMHDIGKIGVPDAVLLKPGKLTPEERTTMERHVLIGVQLIDGIHHLRPALAIPRYHHEWFDGTGYSERLAGEDIPLEARMFAVIDVYDALTNDRPYKAAMSHAASVEIILFESGTHFDPAVVSAFRKIPQACWTSLAASASGIACFSDAIHACRTLQEQRQIPNDEPTRAALPVESTRPVVPVSALT